MLKTTEARTGGILQPQDIDISSRPLSQSSPTSSPARQTIERALVSPDTNLSQNCIGPSERAGGRPAQPAMDNPGSLLNRQGAVMALKTANDETSCTALIRSLKPYAGEEPVDQAVAESLQKYPSCADAVREHFRGRESVMSDRNARIILDAVTLPHYVSKDALNPLIELAAEILRTNRSLIKHSCKQAEAMSWRRGDKEPGENNAFERLTKCMVLSEQLGALSMLSRIARDPEKGIVRPHFWQGVTHGAVAIATAAAIGAAIVPANGEPLSGAAQALCICGMVGFGTNLAGLAFWSQAKTEFLSRLFPHKERKTASRVALETLMEHLENPNVRKVVEKIARDEKHPHQELALNSLARYQD